ncbi:hypothetical protein KIN20_034308 [Parelaphostrongylus tenuis]|uniref:Uncharacterized protein n=1 Tax=Parelaphostrongylus tenuis TaxID=148309 RepID=A0AAD5WJK5_PARTN|nr:hypothetical protein KIN20_034308 [Parelaphostrongylus tenuis]
MEKVGASSASSQASEDETESDEEIIINDSQRGVQRKSPSANLETPDPPSTAPTSIMYVDTSSDETSDDEESRETMPPIQRSQGIVNIHKVLHVPPDSPSEVSGKNNGNVLSTNDVGTNLFNKTKSDDETEKTSEKKSLAVTKIVLEDDSSPTNQFSSVKVKMNFEAREAMTDEEFSEKLI